MSKRKAGIVKLSIIVLIVVAGLTYFLNAKFHFLADVLEGPYVIFQKENFAQVTWDTEPAAGEILESGATISTFAAQGQTEDISFSVRPNQDLGDVQIDLSDLKMGNKVIPKENIEVLNLKVWEQCAPKATNPNGNWIVNCLNTDTRADRQTIRAFLPELLVKNNQQDLIASETAYGSGPEIDPIFKATLNSGKTHTFYLRIKVPVNAEAGDYSADVTFAPANGVSGQNFKLCLKVLPFSLPDSNKEISTHVGYRINDTFFQSGRQKISEENYGKYLDFLRESGFTTLIVSDYNNIDKVAKMMKDRGFKRIIWRALQYPTSQWTDPTVSNEIKTKINQIKAAGFEEVFLYGYDEPAAGDKILYNMEFAKFAHESGAKLATSMIKQVNDISSNSSAPLLLHDSTGLNVEETITDLPIYSGGASNTSFLSDYVGLYFDKSWSFPLLGDVPSFIVFPRGETVTIKNKTVNGSTVKEYSESLAKNTWHHVAGVWDGVTNDYKLYVDNEQSEDFEYSYKASASPFGNNLLKNGNRTYIGATIDAIKPLSTGKSRDAITAFRGNIANVKIYDTALSKAEIDQGTATPRVNYDFSDGSLDDKTGNYPACQKVVKDGGEINVVDDNPVAGKKSLYFSGSKYGPSAIEAANSPHLDCGVISDNYGVQDSITVEFWIKLPNETNISNVNGAVISRQEAYDRSYSTVEDYILGMKNHTITKNNKTEFFYAQIWPEFGNLAGRRGYSGFVLQAIGLDGFSPYGLDSPYNSEGPKYYDDFDANEKAEFAVLPSKSGDPVITYQFEAFRAGVDDSRFYTLYERLLTQLRAKHPQKASDIDREVQTRLSDYIYNYNGVGAAVFTGQPNSYHQANRKLVADKIIEMQDFLNPPSPKPSFIEQVNVSEGQKIKNNPYMLSVQVKDPSAVSKVEYYVDDILIGTTTLPSVNKVYDWPWDTSKYHSLVRIVVYGTDGTTEEITRNTTVALGDNPPASDTNIIVLPKTGGSNLVTWLGNFLTAVINEVKIAF